jgi:transcriptional regulator with XRE-family HTH domain
MGNSMPARAPTVSRTIAAKLVAIGQRIRAHRKALRVSATAAAEAAGMSRVTLYRIEQGEPSVAMGAYMSAIAALGLDLELADSRAWGSGARRAPRLPPTIRLEDYPQLRRLAWQRKRVDQIAPKEALKLYERNWRHVDRNAMDARELELVKLLVDSLGGGRLLV